MRTESGLMTGLAPLLAAAVLLGPGAAAAQGGKTSALDVTNAPVCGTLPAGVDTLVCQCPTGFSGGSVWGSGPYTGDSSICSAAQHAGLIDTSGGAVVVMRRPGQAAYQGSARNGVTTQDWGSYGESFDLFSPGGRAGTGAGAGFAQTCAAFPGGSERYDCVCGPAGSAASVWGSGPYTADSDICTAARHAGVIGAGGGPVSVLGLGGLAGYAATTANGVTTSSWGSYGESFVFNRN